MHHLSDASFLRYASGRASEAEQLRVDAHLADCPHCRERLGALVYLREHFEAFWDSWSAAEHGRLYRRWRLVKALKEAAEVSPDLADRAFRWLEQAKGGLEMGIRLLLDRIGRIATVASGQLPPGYGFGLRPAFVGVGSPAELAELQKQLQRGSDLLSRGEVQQAVGALREAARIDARSPQAADIEIRRGGRLVMQVTADSRWGRVWARFFADPEGPLPELALLLPASPEGVPLIAGFQPVAGEAVLLAEFTGVGDGPHALWILFEPTGPKGR